MAEKGTLANDSGSILEQAVKSVFAAKGFEKVMFREWAKQPDRYGKELLLLNIPFTSIYGHSGNTEFRLISERYNKDIRLECKWQQSAGSVDEKLPYLYLNCIEAMPEQSIIIVIDGCGWKKGAVEWLKRAANERKYATTDNNRKDISVMDLKDFLTWANTTFR